MLVELLAGDTGLDHHVEVLGVNGEDPVHLAHVDRHAAERRVDVPLKRGADPIGNDRHAVVPADADDLNHLLGRMRKDHRVGSLRREPCRGRAVLLADRFRADETLAEALRKDRQGDCDARIVPRKRFDRALNRHATSAATVAM